ncbi:phage tail family protein [Kitasatospora sp. MBT63]|uniref:phage tail family protein n=1 Tax=Kitasatospora sp. MBT63 TaxID=1444768 RepID=UPI00068B7ACA|nr:phage tail family protein [Kitasatospora sp. MBT63]
MAAELADWQLDVAGVVIGHGTDVLIEDVQGLGTAPLRTADVDIPGEDGSFAGVDLQQARTVRITAGIRSAGNPTAVLDRLGALVRAGTDEKTRLQAGRLVMLRAKRPGQATRCLVGRVRRVEAVSIARAVHGWLPIEIEFTATDPLWQADSTSGVTLPLDISSAKSGFAAPLVAPITTGVANPTARPGWMLNVGDRPAWPSIRITGPIVNPRLWIVETSRALEMAPFTLGDGEYVQIETRPGTRTVLRNGSGNAAGSLTASSRLDLFRIPAGRSELRWIATDFTNTARLAVTWRDAYTAL